MKRNRRVEELTLKAHKELRCIVPEQEKDAKALRLRRQAGELVSPYRGIFAEPEIWKNLTPPERSRQVATALHIKHPTWVFAGLTAASIHQLTYRYSLHNNNVVYIGALSKIHNRKSRKLQYIHHRQLGEAPLSAVAINHINSIPVTSMAQTIVDCAAAYDFRDVLPMLDQVLRQGSITADQVSSIHITSSSLQRRIRRLIEFCDAASENGGESLCRGTIIEAGFAQPRTQVKHTNPFNRRMTFRTDFELRAADGRTVALEYDGSGKYLDPAMTKGRSFYEVLDDERNRQDILLQCGIARFVRTNYEEVVKRTPLIHKLLEAGVPLVRPEMRHVR